MGDIDTGIDDNVFHFSRAVFLLDLLPSLSVRCEENLGSWLAFLRPTDGEIDPFVLS